MDNKIKCLKCGKSGVQEESLYVDRTSEKRIGVMRNVVGGGFLILVGGVFCLSVVGMLMGITTKNIGDLVAVVFWSAISVPMLILGFDLIVRHFKANKTRLFQYRCTCGHQWEQWEDGWDSVPCPECGNSMVTTHIFPLNPQDPKERKRPDRSANLLGGSMWLAIGICLIGLAVWLWFDTPLFQGLGVKVFLTGFGIGALSWGRGSLSLYFGKKWVKLFMYQCAVCGHHWERREDENDLTKQSSEETINLV